MRAPPNRPLPRAVAAILGVLATVLSVTAYAARGEGGLEQVYLGKLYEIGSHRSIPLFEYQLSETRDGQHRASRYFDLDRHLVAQEEVLLAAGKLQRYTVELPAAQRSGRIERVGEELRFLYTTDGQTEEASEDWGEDVVVGLMLVPFIQAHWDKLSSGETLRVRLAVADRLRTFGFQLASEAPSRVDGTEAVTIVFKPTSWFVRLLAEPLHFTLSPDGTTVYEISGRTTPLRKVSGEWESVDADGVYTKLER